MKIFSTEHLRGLHVGDSFGTEGFFQGLTKSEVMWTVIAASAAKMELRATYLGIAIDSARVEFSKGKQASVKFEGVRRD